MTARDRDMLVDLLQRRAAQHERHAVYLSGPMSGLPDLNHAAFDDVARDLRSAGLVVLSPPEIGRSIETNASYAAFMRADLQALVTHAAVICRLDGWEESRGAKLELEVAECLGLIIVNYADIGAKTGR